MFAAIWLKPNVAAGEPTAVNHHRGHHHYRTIYYIYIYKYICIPECRTENEYITTTHAYTKQFTAHSRFATTQPHVRTLPWTQRPSKEKNPIWYSRRDLSLWIAINWLINSTLMLHNKMLINNLERLFICGCFSIRLCSDGFRTLLAFAVWLPMVEPTLTIV